MPQYYELMSENVVATIGPSVITRAAEIPNPTISSGSGLFWRGPPASDRVAVTSNSQTGAIPAGAVSGDTIVGILPQDDASHIAPNLPTTLTDYAIVKAMAWPSTFFTGLAVWTATFTGEGSITHGPGAGSLYDTAIYAVNGTVSAVTTGTTDEHSGTAAVWDGVSMNDGDLAIAVTSVYDPADAYTKADSNWREDYNSTNWVGLTLMSQQITSTGTVTVSPAGTYAGTGNMTTLIIRIAA